MKLKLLTLAILCSGTTLWAAIRPSHAVNAGTKTFFLSTPTDPVIKLWVSDGTASGTKEAYADAMANKPVFLNTATANTHDVMIGLNNKVIFKAQTASLGEELWVSDGTQAGTFLLKDIRAGAASSGIQNFVRLGNKVVFLANDGIHEQELWITDGTSAGTHLLKDLGSSFSLFSDFKDWKVLNNKLYFGRKGALIWPELWVTDGTASGTKNIVATDNNGIYNPNTFLSDGSTVFLLGVDGLNTKYVYATTNDNPAVPIATYFVHTPLDGQVLNNKLFFRQPDNNLDSEMWISDGTQAGTKKLQNDTETNRIRNTERFFKHIDRIYFSGYKETTWTSDLWKSDGTSAGTSAVQGGMQYNWVTQPIRFNGKAQAVSVGSHFYFEGNYYLGSSTELWKSNGTDAGTQRIKTFTGSGLSLELSNDNVFGTRFYFKVIDASSNEEFWVSDGTDAGTVKISELVPSLNLSSVQIITQSATDVYFTANLGGSGFEVFKTNGLTVTRLTGSCPESVIVSSTVSTSVVHKAATDIEGKSEILSPAKVTYQAGRYVVLNPGFEANTGSVFTAQIAGCLD